MSRIRIIPMFAAATLAVACGAAAAQQATSVNLDGSTKTMSKAPTLAASANRALMQADVPSSKTDLASTANADMTRRNTLPRLKAERQNLKGADAKHVIAEQQNPSTYDRDISMGDKDHTEQVTDLKVYMKK